ncbi:MAG: hypothetical protein MUF15_04835 [Acidobacteria bacterium]|jgi:hypothetical protein|nr:hypothetical protein [Acidobacteriota bacterium]
MKDKLISILLFAAFLFFSAANAAPQATPNMTNTQVSISVSENLAFIGDRIRLKIIIKTTSDVDNINVKSTAKEFDILDDKPTQKRKEQDAIILEKQLEIAFFKTGDFNVGPFTVELKKNDQVIGTKETNSVPVTVKTTLKEEDKDIKPLKSLIELKGNPMYILKYLIVVIALIGIILFVLYWLKRRKAKAAETPKRLLSPLEELELRIKELYQQSLFEKGKMKLFFLELTIILKQFIQRSYQFKAEDFTTYETLYDLKKCESDAQILNNMEFLFITADLVKFAKYIPEAGVLDELAKKIDATIGIYKTRVEAAVQQEQKEKVS